MTRKFSELCAKMSPEARELSRKMAERYREEMTLDEGRKAREGKVEIDQFRKLGRRSER